MGVLLSSLEKGWRIETKKKIKRVSASRKLLFSVFFRCIYIYLYSRWFSYQFALTPGEASVVLLDNTESEISVTSLVSVLQLNKLDQSAKYEHKAIDGKRDVATVKKKSKIEGFLLTWSNNDGRILELVWARPP